MARNNEKRESGKKAKPKKSLRHRLYRLLIILLIVLLLVGLGGIRFTKHLEHAYQPNSTKIVDVEIPSGSSTAEIADILTENEIIASPRNFRLVTKLTGDSDYKAGTYKLSAAMSMNEIRDILLKGESANTVKVQIPEGYTVVKIADELEKNGVCSAEEFLQETQTGEFDYEFMAETLEGEKRLEGFLYPDTYEFYENDDPHSVINKMLARFDQKFNAVVDASQGSEILEEYTTLEIVTVASLIEKEAFHDEDRAPIASVIYNRLDEGMKLQLNPTVEYVIGEIRDLTYDDLAIDSPYNTYKYEGLPIGPIASPSQASLEAAINPADTNYMFFVNTDKGDWSMAFSETYEEFLKDKAAWQASR